MNLDHQTKAGIIMDDHSTTMETLKREGYKKRIPRVEYFLGDGKVGVIGKDENVKKFTKKELIEILEDTNPVNNSEKELIKEWCNATDWYRYFLEIYRLEEKITKAKEQGGVEVKLLEEQIVQLVEERDTTNPKDSIKKEVAYLYNEEGARLERLYQILHPGCANLRFGLINISISGVTNLLKIGELAYKKSKGFFEDLSEAYNLLGVLKGTPEYSHSAGVAYTTEQAFGRGNTALTIGDEEITLEATIGKEYISGELSCYIKTSKLRLGKNEVLKNVELFLPSYALEHIKDGDLLGSNNKGVIVWYSNNSKSLTFYGKPEKLKEEVQRFLENVLK